MITSRLISSVCRTVVPRRNGSHFVGSIVSGPPTVQTPFIELVTLGGMMIGSFLVIPAWVLVHLEEYKAH